MRMIPGLVFFKKSIYFVRLPSFVVRVVCFLFNGQFVEGTFNIPSFKEKK